MILEVFQVFWGKCSGPASCIVRVAGQVKAASPVSHKFPVMYKAVGYKILLSHHFKTRCWFQIFFCMFTPVSGEMIQFDEQIFQMGWWLNQRPRKCSMHRNFLPRGWLRGYSSTLGRGKEPFCAVDACRVSCAKHY